MIRRLSDRSNGVRGAVAPILFALFATGPLLAGAALGASGPSLAFEQPRATFEPVYQRAVVEQVFPFTNLGSQPVSILAVRPRSEGGTGEAVPRQVPPGGKGEIRVRQPVGDRLGLSAFRIAIDTDDPGAPLLRLGLSGFVESAYEPQAPRLDFGTLFTEAGGERSIELASREVERLEVRSIAGAPGFLDVRVAGRSGEVGEGVRIVARVATGAPIGIHNGTLVVSTNVPNQPEVAVPWSATVYGDVVPDRNPVSFDLVRLGQSYEASVVLRSRSGKPVAVDGIADPDGRVAGTVGPCPGPDAGDSCRQLRLSGLVLATGAFGGTLAVRIRGQEAPLPIRYAGLAISSTAKVKTLGFTQGEDDSEEVTAPRLPFDPVRSPAEAPPSRDAPTEETRPVSTLHWQASKEEGIFGYRVLRSTSRLGPFVRVDSSLIRVPAERNEKNTYAFKDFGVVPGATYYYYLDLVTTSGEVRRFSGVLSKTVSSAPVSPRTTDAPSPPPND